MTSSVSAVEGNRARTRRGMCIREQRGQTIGARAENSPLRKNVLQYGEIVDKQRPKIWKPWYRGLVFSRGSRV